MRSGAGAPAGGALVALVLKAERNSQWRLRPWTRSSASPITREIWETMLVLAWTWEFRLLVMPARLSSERSRFSAKAVRLLLALASVAFALANALSNWRLALVEKSHLPSAPGWSN